MRIGATTRLCAVIGHPVRHSLSPVIHNVAFERAGFDGVYTAFEVTELEGAVAGVRALGIRGLSVTLPHKVAIAPLLDELDPVAERIGAVNTVVNEDGRLRGFNTDGTGAVTALRRAGADPAGRHVAVLGTGGSARAIAFALALRGGAAGLRILGRRPGAARALADEVATAAPGVDLDASTLDPEEIERTLAGSDLVVHTTPVGMRRTGEDTSPDCLVPPGALHGELAVFDIVYTPMETELVRRARAAGARVVPGIEMLLEQAAEQFVLWTGLDAPLDAMRAAALERLGTV